MAIDQKLFDLGVNRENTDCVKWDGRQEAFGRADVIPLWVADMDFAAPPAVVDALVSRAQQGSFGYTMGVPADKQAVVDWMKSRHDTEIKPEEVIFSPGVIDSMKVALAAVAQPGDKIVINTPVYPPFYDSIRFNKMEIVGCTMIHEGADWRMNYEAIEEAYKDGAKVMLLCNPHNPVGRIWTREELERLVALNRRYGVQLIADEIHADLEMPEYRNTCVLKVDPDAIALISGTKTFNLAGLKHSSVLIKNEKIRENFLEIYHARGVGAVNLFGNLAQRVAYQTGAEWLDALCRYLAGTRDMVEKFLKEELPEITCSRLQGTYLMWLDFRALGMEQNELYRFLIDQAGVGLNNGSIFGPEGNGFMRLNIGTPRSNVERALNQMRDAIRSR